MCLGTKLNSSKMKNWQEAVGSQAGTEALNSWLLHNLDSRSRWMAILHSEHALSGCDDRLMTPAMTWIGRMTRTVDPGRALAPLLAPGPELRNLGSLQYGAPNRFSTPLSRTCCGLAIIVMCKSLLKPVSLEYYLSNPQVLPKYWGYYPSIILILIMFFEYPVPKTSELTLLYSLMILSQSGLFPWPFSVLNF